MDLKNQVDNMNKLRTIPQVVVSIKTNYLQNHKYGYCKATKVNKNILLTLYKEGVISGFREENDSIKIKLKYYRDKSLLNNIKTVYKPSLKLSQSYLDIEALRKRHDIFFLSTSFGMLSSNQLIKLRTSGIKTGGQVLVAVDLINNI